MLQKIVLLALAGALGTTARFGLAALVHRIMGADFPWGTLVVNVVGCFLAGVFWALSQHTLAVSPQMRLVVMIGFMGAFTTFSAFMLETGQMMQDTGWLHALGNILLQNVVGILALFAGLATAKGVFENMQV